MCFWFLASFLAEWGLSVSSGVHRHFGGRCSSKKKKGHLMRRMEPLAASVVWGLLQGTFCIVHVYLRPKIIWWLMQMFNNIGVSVTTKLASTEQRISMPHCAWFIVYKITILNLNFIPKIAHGLFYGGSSSPSTSPSFNVRALFQ